MARVIGIRHRTKRTKEGEARPTMIAVKDGENVKVYELEEDDDEKDFLLGRYPTKYHNVTEPVDETKYFPHHLKRDDEGEVVRVPSAYEGLKAGDMIAMILGGSGDRFAAALSRRGEEIGATVQRIPPFTFKTERGAVPKEDDHLLLASLFQAKPELFQKLLPRDRDLIRLRESFMARKEAQRARIGCEQRLRQQLIGRIFLDEEGRFPEGSIEDMYDREKASNVIFKNLRAEEREREKELKICVHALSVWELFEGVEGCGEVIAAGIVSAIGDIRRFKNAAKLKAFSGMHVLPDGRIPRRREGSTANWQPLARQALWLLGDQFNKRPDSVWGKKLREYKVRLREKHPEVLNLPKMGDDGKPVVHPKTGKPVTVSRYSPIHIHKMAIWRTLTKFTEWLFREWTKLEKLEPAPVSE